MTDNARMAAWMDRARAAPLLETAQRAGAQLKRAGVEMVGPCPQCGGTDRFAVNPKQGVWNCRGALGGGDAISLVMHVMSCEFIEACEFITDEPRPDRSMDETDQQRRAREAKQKRIKDAAEARRKAEEKSAEWKRRQDEEAIAAVLERATPIWGTHAEAYLRARGLRPAKRLCGDLRMVAELDYWGHANDGDEKKTHLATLPAMVAIVRDAAGAMIGIHQTFLDPVDPRKWKPIGAKTNGAKKIRGEAKGGMIRLGMLGDKLVIAEGIETALSAYALGLGPEDASFAAAVSLGNLAGKWTGTNPHPTRRGPNGKPTRVPNGKPDMDAPGVILPDDVREVLIVADSDSERLATQGAILTAGRRWVAQSRLVTVWWAPPGKDANDFLQRQQCGEAAHCEKISAGLVAAHVRRRQTNAS